MALATTWNEPWHEQVVKEADSFVRVQVLKNENGRRVTAKPLKQLAGAVVPAEFTIDQFWMLKVTSWFAGYGPELRLKPGTVYYVLVKKNRSGPNWALPTPTAGFAETEDEQVKATYRHSYHMALVPTSLYEPTMAAIFRFLHNQPFDTLYIAQLFKQQLTVPPGDLTNDKEPEAMKRFFAQHAALECFYYFGTANDYVLLKPFLRSS